MTTPPTRIGKPTVAASVGSIIVQLRKMAGWWPSTPTPPWASWRPESTLHAVGSYWNLAADDHLDTFADVR